MADNRNSGPAHKKVSSVLKLARRGSHNNGGDEKGGGGEFMQGQGCVILLDFKMLIRWLLHCD